MRSRSGTSWTMRATPGVAAGTMCDSIPAFAKDTSCACRPRAPDLDPDARRSSACFTRRRRSPLVQGRGHLSGARQVVLRHRQRRHGRSARDDAEARLPPRSRHHLLVAAAVLPLAAERRRLRHRGLLQRQSALRHSRRLPRAGPSRARSSDQGADRAGHQPHLRSASVVPARAARAETLAVLRRMRQALDDGYKNRMLLAEANQWPSDVRDYFGNGDECHMAFHFPLMPRMFMALQQEDRHAITEILSQTPDIPENCQWALFLRNHDELTLEMVTDEERDYMYSVYADDPQMRINVGIRRRLAPLVENSRRRIELLNALLFSFPGTPIVYYGDEIGMGDNIYLGDRNGVRTPMQWSSDKNGGFSRADPARLFAPPIMDPVYGYQAINVEAQERYPFSPLNWTKRMIAMRKQHRVFGRGSLEFVGCANRKVLAYLRRDDRETILVVVNLARSVQPAELDLRAFAGQVLVE